MTNTEEELIELIARAQEALSALREAQKPAQGEVVIDPDEFETFRGNASEGHVPAEVAETICIGLGALDKTGIVAEAAGAIEKLVAERESLELSNAAWKERVHDLRLLNNSKTPQLEEAWKQLDEAYEEADRYKKALDRAKATLRHYASRELYSGTREGPSGGSAASHLAASHVLDVIEELVGKYEKA